ncbi:MAG: hypothetical protein ACR2ID_09530 [Chthoniobacterales bacterium]
MKNKTAEQGNCLVLVWTSDNILRAVQRPPISPQRLLAFVTDQQRIFAQAFKAFPDVEVHFELTFARAIWRVDRRANGLIYEALGVLFEIIQANERYNSTGGRAYFPRSNIHAGVDMGLLLQGEDFSIGQVLTSAFAFAEEATRRDVTAFIPQSYYEDVAAKLNRPLATQTVEVKATTQKQRGVIALSLDDIENLKTKR